jgi:hypothetical protein
MTMKGNKRSLIPEQVKWETVGVEVVGVLRSKEETIYQDNTRGRYIIETDNGLKVLLGTYQLDQAFKMVEVGDNVGVEYLGEEGTSRGNKFKIFDVWMYAPGETHIVPKMVEASTKA